MLRNALILAAIGTALPAAAQSVMPPVATWPADATLLEVSAEGKATRTPDIATIRAGVVSQAATAAAALSDNAQRMTRVVAALRRAGVADRDLQTAQIQLQPQYRYAENQPPAITGYQASNSVSVRFREVAKSGAILDALVTQGANQIDGPTLSVDAADAALDEARTDAIRRARARADLYARAAGLRVDRILSITEGGAGAPPPVMPMMMARVAVQRDESTPIAPGEQELTANVTVRFVLR
ncbi:SIMPL domain-containing protein [Sphingomonas silueang]|uniref:SIMPL domain-containing protein n=1 Tax=Sphingomonas silueang TaxID=3156617 RepID=UPI0032B55156